MRTACALLSLVAVASCSSESTQKLYGYQSPTVKNSSGVTVTDAVSQKPFELRAPKDELLVVYFGYTNCPDICPTTLVTVKNALKKIGDDAERVSIAMITVDPARDTAEILPRYLSSFTDKFHALIPRDNKELRTAEAPFDATSSVTTVNGRTEVTHGGNCYIVDSSGTVRIEFPFGMDAAAMAHDFTLLLQEREKTT